MYLIKFGRVLLLCLYLCFVGTGYAQKVKEGLSVYVIDEQTKEPIADAVISVGKLYYLSDKKGFCLLDFPTNRVDSVYIQLLGYKQQRVSLSDIIEVQPFFVSLSLEENFLDAVVIEGKDQSSTQNAVAQILSSDEISKNIGASLAASLEGVKGVSFIKSGTTVVKPVIQGMHSNRVLIINNGVRQEGQAWGEDHAPEIDLNNAEYVSVVKGAESVRYGSKALGGVIKLEPRLLPYSRRGVKGSLSSSYGSNGNTYAATGYVDGTISLNRNFAWRLQGSYINGGDRSTANYLLNNTGVREVDFSGAIGYRNTHCGVDLFYSNYNSRIGVLYTSQRGDVDLFKERIEIGRPLDITPFSRHIDYPYQHVIHQIARLKAFYQFKNKSQLNFQYAYQIDARDEFHTRRNNLSHVPSLSLDLTAHQLDLDWEYAYKKAWKSKVGFFYAATDNVNQAGTGVVPVIPNFTSQSVGAFAIQKLTKEKWSAEAGLRFDYEVSKADGFDVYGERYGGQRRFSNFTYNIGGSYQLSDRWSIVSNFGLAYRAPHVHELYSNGLDHVSGIYMIGDVDLDSEKSTKWITEINYNTSFLSFSIEGFLQKVRNYIYDEPSQDYMTVVSGTYPVFKFKQVDALFRGVDAELKIQPFARIDYTAKAGIIWANEQATNRYLPYIPSFTLMQSVGYHTPKWRKIEPFKLSLNHRFVAKQNRFDPKTDLISFTPPAYHLFGLEVSNTLLLKHSTKLTFVFEANNLFNKEYKEYTNRFRYYAHDAGRDLRFVVIWNF